MQNLTASTNFQLFQKGHQDQQSPVASSGLASNNSNNSDPNDSAQQQQFAEQLHQLMMAQGLQLDQGGAFQQLYLSQLAAATDPTTAALFQSPQQQQHHTQLSNGSDAATTTSSSTGAAHTILDQRASPQDTDEAAAAAMFAQAQQKMMEAIAAQFGAGATSGPNNQMDLNTAELLIKQMSGGGIDFGGAQGDEIAQQIAQLLNAQSCGGGIEQLLNSAVSGVNGGDNDAVVAQAQQQLQLLAASVAAESQAQQQQLQLQSPPINASSTGGDQHQSQQQHSPSSQQQQMLEQQFQLLQMLNASGGGNGNAMLEQLFAGAYAGGGTNGSNAADPFNLLKAMEGEIRNNPAFLNQSGAYGMGGNSQSPNKSVDSYCEICDKNYCNRYFLKTHKQRKHGIVDDGPTGSPMKLNANFFGNQSQTSGAGGSFDEADASQALKQMQQQQQPLNGGRSASLSFQQRPPSSSVIVNKNEAQHSPPLTKPLQKQHSTPGQTQQSTDGISSPDQQQLLQTLANQMGLYGDDRLALVQQLLSASGNQNLVELMLNADQSQQTKQVQSQNTPSSQQQNQQQASTTSSSFPCLHCSAEFSTHAALFQHQLSEHISDSLTNSSATSGGAAADGGAAALAAMMGMSNSAQQQQQLLLGQILGGTSSASGATSGGNTNGFPSSFLLPGHFGGAAGGGDLDAASAAMLAKLGAELLTSSNGGSVSAAFGNLQQSGGSGPNAANKMIPKRQYSSTSKNFCDLCNKEVCNKYFLRTHMLKMHNIVIDENKSVIANIDTSEKEKLGQVSFRCDICHVELKARNDLRTHKRDVHGMQPIMGLQTPPTSRTPHRVDHQSPASTSKTSAAQSQRFFGDVLQQQQSADGQTAESQQQDVNRSSSSSASSSMQDSVQQILNQLCGLNSVPGGSSAERKQSQDSGKEQVQQQQQKSEDSTKVDGNNNNFPCTFCDLSFDTEQSAQLHQLMTHYTQLAQNNSSGSKSPDENEIIIQVAQKMAKENERKTSSTSASSSTTISSVNQPGFPCSLCKGKNRSYKTLQNLEHHQRTVHHKFVAKLSPMKRAIISPKKVKKMRTCFTCVKCQRRFATSKECREHVIAHLRAEKLTEKEQQENAMRNESLRNHHLPISEEPSAKRVKTSLTSLSESNNIATESPLQTDIANLQQHHIRESSQENRTESGAAAHYDEALVQSWMREEEPSEEAHQSPDHQAAEGGSHSTHDEEEEDEGMDDMEEDPSTSFLAMPMQVESGGIAVVDAVVDALHQEHQRREQQDGGQNQKANGNSRQMAKRAIKEEKHSHTSGSASPLSATHSIPEGYAQPIATDADLDSRPYTMQSFMLRTVRSPASGGGSGSGTPGIAEDQTSALLDELVAYLPVRSNINEPFKVTFELHPAPQIDAQVHHL